MRRQWSWGSGESDRTTRLAVAAAIALLVGAMALVPIGTSAPRTGAACTAVTNVEAIIDDSASMSGTDFNRLRVAALDLLISKPQNAGLMLGAVEFGSRANSLFTPGDRLEGGHHEVDPDEEGQGRQRLDELQRRALAARPPRIRALRRVSSSPTAATTPARIRTVTGAARRRT